MVLITQDFLQGDVYEEPIVYPPKGEQELMCPTKTSFK